MSTATELSPAELIVRFEALRFPAAEFSHRQHVKLAFAYLLESDLLEAMARFRTALKRFAEKHGANGLYNETITLAFIAIINDRMQTSGARDFEVFAQANADVMNYKPSILERYYSLDTLRSERAKKTFLWPELM